MLNNNEITIEMFRKNDQLELVASVSRYSRIEL
jgi:hypothetical protein